MHSLQVSNASRIVKAHFYAGYTVQGTCGLSVQWAAWAKGGMATRNSSTAARMERSGLGMLPPERGLAALSGLLLQGPMRLAPLAAAVPFKWDAFLKRLTGKVPEMFSDFAEEDRRAAQVGCVP